jgi:anti-anti-sigma factor
MRDLAWAGSVVAPDRLLGEVRLYTGRQLVVTRTEAPDGLRFAGEIDAANAADVEPALRSFHATGTLHLDLSTLLFCDVSGIRAMVSYAQGLDGERRLRLHGLPDQIERVLDVIGWGEMPGLEFCNCEMSS